MTRTTFIALVALAATCQAPAADYASLLSNSPFAPIGPGAASGGDKSVEFRGMFTDDKRNTYFSILDVGTQKSAWVGMNETGHPFVVRSYNAANDTLTVELGGHNVNLSLKHAAVQLAAATVRPAMPAPTPGEGGPPRGGRWMQNVMGSDGRPDPKRMEAFIEEMRRRRAQRMQSFAAQNPGEGGAPNAPGAGTGPMPMPTAAQGGQAGNIPMPTPSSGPGAVPVDLNNPNR
ncbi:MAG TPA: hypothetical protein VGM73_00645 [Candidatus Didemnitutus sp.]|jgi:hypothetical protein